MKKKNMLLIYLLILINIVCLIKINVENYGLRSINPLPYRKFNCFENKVAFKEYYKDNVELKTDIDEQLNIVLSNLYNAQNFLANLDISIKVIKRDDMLDISKELNIDSFAGLYKPDKKEILIVEYDTDTSIHELGHAVYFQLINNSKKNLINKYFKEESINLIDEYGQTNVEEFFAVAFTEYIYSPDTLKQNCPKTYKLIDKINNKLK